MRRLLTAVVFLYTLCVSVYEIKIGIDCTNLTMQNQNGVIYVNNTAVLIPQTVYNNIKYSSSSLFIFAATAAANLLISLMIRCNLIALIIGNAFAVFPGLCISVVLANLNITGYWITYAAGYRQIAEHGKILLCIILPAVLVWLIAICVGSCWSLFYNLKIEF